MSRATKLRAADVARWVAAIATCPQYGSNGPDAVKARRRAGCAAVALENRGIGHDGLPKVKAVAS